MGRLCGEVGTERARGRNLASGSVGKKKTVAQTAGVCEFEARPSAAREAARDSITDTLIANVIRVIERSIDAN